MIAGLEMESIHLQFDLTRNGTEVTPLHIAAHVDSARGSLALHDVGRSCNSKVHDFAEWNAATCGRIDTHSAQRLYISAQAPLAPHHHIKDLLLVVDLANLCSFHQRCRRASNVTGRESLDARFLHAHSCFNLWDKYLRLDFQIRHSRNPANRISYF